MSGGHFQYNQHKMKDIRDDIEQIIIDNDNQNVDKWNTVIGYGFSPEVIEKFKEAIKFLDIAYIYAHRIDWLVSGDDGEEQFLKRLADELKDCK